MTKKKTHKYKVGDTMKFRFFDGSIHTGAIADLRYMGDGWDHTETDYSSPQYTVHVPDNTGRYARGYMVYSSISDHRIISVNGELKQPIFKPTETAPITRKPVEINELDAAIEKQKDFINGKVKK